MTTETLWILHSHFCFRRLSSQRALAAPCRKEFRHEASDGILEAFCGKLAAPFAQVPYKCSLQSWVFQHGDDLLNGIVVILESK